MTDAGGAYTPRPRDIHVAQHLPRLLWLQVEAMGARHLLLYNNVSTCFTCCM